jgi:hypothetical protein
MSKVPAAWPRGMGAGSPDLGSGSTRVMASMALASTTWDDFPTPRSGAASARSRRTLINATAVALLLACSLAAAVPALYKFDLTHFAAPATAPIVTGKYGISPVKAARSSLQVDAERFLRDSFQLARRCSIKCAAAWEIGEAETVGRFGAIDVTASLAKALPAGLPLQQSFGAQAADLRVAVAEFARAEAAKLLAPPVAAPVPIRIAPTMLVPLQPPSDSAPSRTAPVPASPPDRTPAKTTVFSQMGAPMEQQASIPPVTRMPPVSAIGRNDGVAVYDISAAVVYMPNGERLEAHSGLGSMVDNPRYVDRRNVGSTPPNTYNLVALEGRFHGVEALRMVPVSGSNTFGRDGFLTHTYMLQGRPGESNGCVVFPNYDRFLTAFTRGAVRRLVVVASLKGSPMSVASLGR